MTEAKAGDTVQVHYRGTLKDGSEFDSSAGREPLSFTVGGGQVIGGFDDAVMGMVIGDKKTVEIACAEAYGPQREDLINQIERERIPEHIELAEGLQLQAGGPGGGQPSVVTVISFDEITVTLDANHPLAGKDLTFEIELVAVG